MIITADWHLQESTSDTVLGEVIPWVADQADRSGDPFVACLGDVFHIRHRLPVRILNDLVEALKEQLDKGISWAFLPGNHDQYDVFGRNALEVLGEIDGVTVWTESGWDQRGLWVPYRKNYGEIKEALLKECPYDDVPKVAFLHAGLHGAWMNDSIRDDGGLDPSCLSRFRRVFLGHYHRHQEIQNAIYVGSPYQTRADEAGQEKGVVCLEADGRWEFRSALLGRRFHKFEIRSLQDLKSLDFEFVDPCDEVRVRTAAGVNPEKVAKALTALGVQSHVVTPDQATSEARLEVSDDESLVSYAKAYVDTVTHDLDKETLMRVFREVTA